MKRYKSSGIAQVSSMQLTMITLTLLSTKPAWNPDLHTLAHFVHIPQSPALLNFAEVVVPDAEVGL